MPGEPVRGSGSLLVAAGQTAPTALPLQAPSATGAVSPTAAAASLSASTSPNAAALAAAVNASQPMFCAAILKFFTQLDVIATKAS